MNKIIVTTVLLVASITLSGCLGTPKCDDSFSIDTVKEIIFERFLKYGYSDIDIKLMHIKEKSYNKKMKFRECSVDVSINGNKLSNTTFSIHETSEGILYRTKYPL